MPDLVTGDNLLAFDIIYEPDPEDDGYGPDFHLVVYKLDGDERAKWVPHSKVNADQLAAALHDRGFLPPL